MIITEEKYNEELTRYVLPFIRLNFEDGYMKSADGKTYLVNSSLYFSSVIIIAFLTFGI
jgi:hypothetical protein